MMNEEKRAAVKAAMATATKRKEILDNLATARKLNEHELFELKKINEFMEKGEKLMSINITVGGA